MKKNLTLAAITAVAIAASSIAVTTDSAFAASTSAPHYKPLICIFLPMMDVCAPAKPAPMMMHHKVMTKMAPKPAMKKKY
jgi:hypothetical protein